MNRKVKKRSPRSKVKEVNEELTIAQRVKARRLEETQLNSDYLVFTNSKNGSKTSQGNLTDKFLKCGNETDDFDTEEEFEKLSKKFTVNFSPVVDIQSGSDEIPAVCVVIPARSRVNSVRSPSSSPKSRRKHLSTPSSPMGDSAYERYFEENASPSSTSRNALSDPNMLNKTEYFDIMGNIPIKHEKEIESLYQKCKYQFHRWYISLMVGYNLCFYGYGSKKKLIEEFFKTHFKDQPLLVINGFEPNLKFKDALAVVVDCIVKPKLGSRRGTFEEYAALIRNYFMNPMRETESLYIMIHNLDGSCLRNTQILDSLGFLASTPNIYIIATVDNVNSPLLFDHDRDANFNFIWYDATTFHPYEEESIYEDIKVKRRRIGLTMNVVTSILSSWIVNRRMMFKTLALHQIGRYLDGAKKPEDAGMEHGLLYNQLRGEFWVDSDSKFRTFLNDFHNHDVIKTRTSEFGSNIYYIPLEADVLKKVLNNYRNLFEDDDDN